MKKTIALCAALLACGSAFAQEESEYAVTMDLPYVTKYVFRGVQIAKDSFQPSVEFTKGDLYLGVWSSVPLRNKHEEIASTEIDLNLGYSPKLTEKLSADVGLNSYFYPNKSHADGDYSVEGFVGLNLELGNFTPAVYVYRDFKLDNYTVQGSLGYSLPLKTLGTSLDFAVTAGTVFQHAGEDYNYYAIGVNVPYKLSDRVKLNVGLTYTENDLDHEKDPGLWGTASIAIRF
jgi:uncharacterized protein (TIGR02001 family)